MYKHETKVWQNTYPYHVWDYFYFILFILYHSIPCYPILSYPTLFCLYSFFFFQRGHASLHWFYDPPSGLQPEKDERIITLIPVVLKRTGSEEIWQYPEMFGGCHNWEGAPDIWWVEAREVINILQRTGQLPSTKDYPAQNINSAVAGKLCSVLNTLTYIAEGMIFSPVRAGRALTCRVNNSFQLAWDFPSFSTESSVSWELLSPLQTGRVGHSKVHRIRMDKKNFRREDSV